MTQHNSDHRCNGPVRRRCAAFLDGQGPARPQLSAKIAHCAKALFIHSTAEPLTHIRPMISQTIRTALVSINGCPPMIAVPSFSTTPVSIEDPDSSGLMIQVELIPRSD